MLIHQLQPQVDYGYKTSAEINQSTCIDWIHGISVQSTVCITIVN